MFVGWIVDTYGRINFSMDFFLLSYSLTLFLFTFDFVANIIRLLVGCVLSPGISFRSHICVRLDSSVRRCK